MKIVTHSKRGPAAGRSGRRSMQKEDSGTPDAGKIRQAIALLSSFPEQMGLSNLSTDDDGELRVTIDPDAVVIGELLRQVIADPSETAATEGIKLRGERLAVLLDQREQLADNGVTARRFDGDLKDTDAFSGKQERDAQDELYAILDELLDGERSPLSQTERDLLAADAGEALKAREDERGARASERARTKDGEADTQAALAATEEEENLLTTLAALKRGQPIDEADLDQVIREIDGLK